MSARCYHLGSFRKYWSLCPSPKYCYLLGPECSLKLLKDPSRDCNVQISLGMILWRVYRKKRLNFFYQIPERKTQTIKRNKKKKYRLIKLKDLSFLELSNTGVSSLKKISQLLEAVGTNWYQLGDSFFHSFIICHQASLPWTEPWTVCLSTQWQVSFCLWGLIV